MASIFCTSCGAKHDYVGFAPNFCSKCGTPTNGKTSAQVQKKPLRTTSSEDVEDQTDDNTDIEELPDIDKLDVEIEIEGGFRAFNLEELSKQPSTAKTKKFIPKRHSGIGDLSPSKYGSSKNEEKD